MVLLLLIVFFVFFPSGAYDNGEGCDEERPHSSTYYCEGFEREFPPEGWAIETTDGELDWDLIHWYGPKGLLPDDYCHGEYYLYPQNRGDQQSNFRMASPIFHFDPAWENMRLDFEISADAEKLPPDSLTVSMIIDGDEKNAIQVFPCEPSDYCTLVYNSEIGPWSHQLITVGQYLQSGSKLQFYFNYKGVYEDAFGIDQISILPDPGNYTWNDYNEFVDRCDYTSNHPPKRDVDDNDDEGCGCGAVDSNAGGGGFFAFALLAFSLFLLYRKRARVV